MQQEGTLHLQLSGEVDVLWHETTASLAAVKITIGGKEITTEAAVSDTLPAAALLGWDIPELVELISDSPKPGQQQSLAAITRRQKKNDDTQKRAQESARREGATGAVTQVAPIIASGGGDADPYPFNFDDSLFPSPG